MISLHDDQTKIVKEVCTERGPINLTLTADGHLELEEYLRLYGMTVALEIRLMKRLDDAFKP